MATATRKARFPCRLAFVEAIRSYVLSREVKDVKEGLGTGAADVARIVSEILERLKVKPRSQKEPEEESS